MRRFIYLDTDTLNSYLAQIFDGLIQSQEMEKTAGKKKEKQNHFGSNLGSQIAFKLFGKGIDANAQATYEHLKTVANDAMVRDVQTKIMHDNAFDEFASYLSENGLLSGANIGNFISVEDEFYIFDIAFFQKMFAEGGFVSELKEIQKVSIQKEAEQQVQGLNRGQQRSKTLQKQVRDIVDAATSKNEEEYKPAEALINMLASIIPYPQILCISNYLVVLNEKYLRDNISTAAFKYGGKVKVVGYITNKVMAQSNTHTSAFAEIGASINALMKIFFENADEMFVVHPVAIYYDN